MGQQIPDSDARVATIADDADTERREVAARADSITAVALAGCAPAVCDAVARGEVLLGMTENQVLAATRTTDDAWNVRRSAGTTVLVPRRTDNAPRDIVAGVAMVQIRNGRVTSFTYREPHGLRVVDSPADATADARTIVAAEALIREADGFVAAGDLDAALDRYDRASILTPRDAILEYRIATILDQQLRPVEALMRYQRFLHQLEIEKIQAVGDANARLSEAIVHARERIIVLERR
jgi:hypothetical protein